MSACSCRAEYGGVPQTVGSLHNVLQHRAARVSHVGICSKGVGWGYKEEEVVRFEELVAGTAVEGPFRLALFGCGGNDDLAH
jgi:hypothetical protein